MYYDSTNNNINTFISNKNMFPGEEYIDEMQIKNESNQTYDLYFNLRMNKQEEIEEKLLNNILMSIYLDNNEIYNGKAKVSNYAETDNEDIIFLGKFSENQISKMTIKTRLDDNFEVKNTNLAKMDIIFYIGNEDGIKVINPKTKDNIIYLFLVISIILLLSFVAIRVKVKKYA